MEREQKKGYGEEVKGREKVEGKREGGRKEKGRGSREGRKDGGLSHSCQGLFSDGSCKLNDLP